MFLVQETSPTLQTIFSLITLVSLSTQGTQYRGRKSFLRELPGFGTQLILVAKPFLCLLRGLGILGHPVHAGHSEL